MKRRTLPPSPRPTRREFMKLSAAVGGGLYLSTRIGGVRHVLRAAIPGGTLNPASIPKYGTPLLVPPAMPRARQILGRGGRNIDYYEIAMRQFRQQILPAGLPDTTVWGYGPRVAQNGPSIFNAPSLTFEAKWNNPVRVKWVNELTDSKGKYLPHLLPVDQTLHWANPPGGVNGRDMRPTFLDTPGPYTGPVPIVTHVHGATGVGDESDGYAEAWYLPAAMNIPAGFARTGTWYDFFRAKAASKFGMAWAPGSATFQYPNTNRACTLWYHDHALGMTRLNVYAGPAGFYIVRGGPADVVMDSRSGTAAALPGPAPAVGDLPGITYYEIPIAIQDRAFNADGSLFYPDSRAFFDEYLGPYIPFTDLSPIWNPEFFGNCIMVNGNTWPFHGVEQRRYRIRALNGCQSRFLVLDFNDIPGVKVWQIGNEGGFLAAPVNITADAGNRVLMGLAERADLIVDFTDVPLGRYVLRNVGPDEPFGGGSPDEDFDASDPDSTGQVMEFRVVAARSVDVSTPPEFLVLPAIAPLPAESTTRKLALLEQESAFHDGPAEAMLGEVADDGTPQHHMWMEPVTENPQVGATEVWELYNLTADAHPMHVHEVTFEVVNRQGLAVDDEDEVTVPVQLVGTPRPAEATERGLKDTVISYPGEVTRIKARFNTPGQFVWHCHIVEHEDNEMMRPYRIGPAQPGEPRT
jgi:FtsP/CotA-like multicopper oxidase with cupredoxin domain